jgi:hypothetical protein
VAFLVRRAVRSQTIPPIEAIALIRRGFSFVLCLVDSCSNCALSMSRGSAFAKSRRALMFLDRGSKTSALEALPRRSDPASWPDLFRPSTSCLSSAPLDVDARHIGERSDAVLRTAMGRAKRRRSSNGYGASEAMPFFERLWPGMTSEKLAASPWPSPFAARRHRRRAPQGEVNNDPHTRALVYLRISRRAMARQCTSSGPSARRSVRMWA